jgi:hypothetical protein
MVVEPYAVSAPDLRGAIRRWLFWLFLPLLYTSM